MNNEKQLEIFQKLCTEYLITCSLGDLRCYGRSLNLPAPTKLKKQLLIDEIIHSICTGKISTRSKRGAPIKNTIFSPEIPSTIEALKEQYFGESYTPPPITSTNSATENVKLQFTVSVDQLTNKQKQLLYQFLDSL